MMRSCRTAHGTRHGQACSDLAQQHNILGEFGVDVRKAGVIGEDRASKILYLALTSRVLDKPVSLAIKGPSSGGKSFVCEKVLSFFPTSAYYGLTAMSGPGAGVQRRAAKAPISCHLRSGGHGKRHCVVFDPFAVERRSPAVRVRRQNARRSPVAADRARGNRPACS